MRELQTQKTILAIHTRSQGKCEKAAARCWWPGRCHHQRCQHEEDDLCSQREHVTRPWPEPVPSPCHSPVRLGNKRSLSKEEPLGYQLPGCLIPRSCSHSQGLPSSHVSDYLCSTGVGLQTPLLPLIVSFPHSTLLFLRAPRSLAETRLCCGHLHAVGCSEPARLTLCWPLP
jgi:hypothetical protein